MDKYYLQRLRDLPVEGVAGRLGLGVNRHKCLCPFHDDHHASLSFSTRRNTYRCFACGAHGGTIDLVMNCLHKEFSEACRWLADEHAILMADETERAPRSAPSATPPFDASRYERFFARPFLSEAARRFLFDERQLDERVVRWCRLTSWRDREGTEWLQIPYYDREGHLTGIQNRNLSFKFQDSSSNTMDSSSKSQDSNNLKPETWNMKPPAPRFRFPAGSVCGIYNLPVLNLLRPAEPLYITEGASDCWAMLSAGHKAVAIPSATLLKPADLKQLVTLSMELETTFHMYPDCDAPGEQLFLQLRQALPHLIRHPLPPGCKDFSEYYLTAKLTPPPASRPP
jgi:DNA primase (bacterial type)